MSPRLGTATRWVIPAAAAGCAVFLVTMASAKGKPARTSTKHAASAQTATTKAGAHPKTTTTHRHTAPAPAHTAATGATGHRTGTHGRHGQAEDDASSAGTAASREASYAAQGRSIVEGQLPPVVEGAVCRADMAIVDSRFCVDRYEGSLVQKMPGGGEQAWSPYDMPEGVSVRAVSAPNVFPQAYISGAQGASACAASGKRLCKPVEWRTACMGPKKQLFPYGNERRRNSCNDHGRAPMGHFFPQVATSWNLVGMTEMNDPRLNAWEGTLMRTGSSPDCTNEYGVFDMVGNLHEWTNDPNGTFQGGYYLDTHINGDGCGYRTTAHEFTYHDYSTGFRCCSDATRDASVSSVATPAASSSASAPASTTQVAPPANGTSHAGDVPPPAPTVAPALPSPYPTTAPSDMGEKPQSGATPDPYESTLPQQ